MFHFCLQHGVEACDLVGKLGIQKTVFCRDCQESECRGRNFLSPNGECVIVKCENPISDYKYPNYYCGYISLLNEYLRAGKSIGVST
jgi:hypothetical protein